MIRKFKMSVWVSCENPDCVGDRRWVLDVSFWFRKKLVMWRIPFGISYHSSNGRWMKVERHLENRFYRFFNVAW